MPKGYIVADLHVTATGEDIRRYRDAVPATIAQYGGRFLARGGEPKQLEGTPTPGAEDARRLVIVEFPSVAQAMVWYNSPEYQAILPLRLKTMTGPVIIGAGYEA
jgi:uncharacterized protein (DUF1330 family)